MLKSFKMSFIKKVKTVNDVMSFCSTIFTKWKVVIGNIRRIRLSFSFMSEKQVTFCFCFQLHSSVVYACPY